jgi:uncharacterized protein YggU (UPF0235/DUF167 family)
MISFLTLKYIRSISQNNGTVIKSKIKVNPYQKKANKNVMKMLMRNFVDKGYNDQNLVRFSGG